MLLDEPTVGLHYADVQRLLEVLGELVERGDTVIVIEHNLDVIRNSDWVVDLGPGGGDDGGRLVAEGPPEAIVATTASWTGRYLAEAMGAAADPVFSLVHASARPKPTRAKSARKPTAARARHR